MTPLVLVIFGCSLIQSVFGIGILFLGTPILLMLGFSFDAALLHLLPCSIAVSCLQIRSGRRVVGAFYRPIIFYCLPFLALGCFLKFQGFLSIQIKPLIGLMLLTAAALRSFPKFSSLLTQALTHAQKPAFALLGLIHGFTNMGGALLTAMVSSLYANKTEIRANIALGYLLMALLQLILLLAIQRPIVTPSVFFLPLISIATYRLLGNRLFLSSSQVAYQHLMTLFLLALGFKMVF